MVNLKKLFHKKTNRELEKEVMIERKRFEAIQKTKALQDELKALKRGEYQTKHATFVAAEHKAEKALLDNLNKAGDALIKHIKEKRKEGKKGRKGKEGAVRLEFI